MGLYGRTHVLEESYSALRLQYARWHGHLASLGGSTVSKRTENVGCIMAKGGTWAAQIPSAW